MILTKKVIEYGVIIALINVAVSVIYYFLGAEFMVKLTTLLINMAIGLFLYIYFGLQYRKSIGGYMSYWNAYVVSGIMIMISGVFAVVFGIILFHVIDPDLQAKMHDAIIQSTINWMTDWKVPQEKIDQTIDQMQKQGDQFSIGKQCIGFIWYLVIAGICSFLIAALTKKQRPLIDEKPLDQAT